MKAKWLLLSISDILVALASYAFWPQPKRRVVLDAYSDSFAAGWALTLYKDGRFHVSVPSVEGAGRFELDGDTVVLHYDKPSAGLPEAYLIDRSRRKITGLKQINHKWSVANDGNWAALRVDSTQYSN